MKLHLLTRKQKLGFTQIEILVVIAIILVITAILLPALEAGRVEAMRTASDSNMRQLGIADIAYSVDNNNLLPPFTNDEILLVNHDPLVRDLQLPTDSKQPELLKSALKLYAGAGEVWFCLADPWRHQPVAFLDVNHAVSSYRFNCLSQRAALEVPMPWPLVSSPEDLYNNKVAGQMLVSDAGPPVVMSDRLSYWPASGTGTLRPDLSLTHSHVVAEKGITPTW